MKYTLITGAASGLGLEFSKLFAADNHNLLLIDLNYQGLVDLKKELESLYDDIKVEILQADLSIDENLKMIYDYTTKNNWFINNLVNCAGFGDCCDFVDMDINKQMKMTDVDCNALLYLTRVYIDDMVKSNEGHIINVSSIAGFVPGPYMCTYHACKGFVLLLSEAIAYELRHTKVKVLALCPGPFESNFVKLAHNDYTFKKIKPISAYDVAKYGYKMSLKGKRIAVVGFKNKLTIFASKIFPRKIVCDSSAKTIKKR